jgi:hypothetical protein
MRRLVLLAVVAVLAGCQPSAPLLMGVPPVGGSDPEGCFLGSMVGNLAVGPDDGIVSVNDQGAVQARLIWHPGFSARWVGTQIEVLDQRRTVVAVTGRRYVLPGEGADGVFWVCASPEELP